MMNRRGLLVLLILTMPFAFGCGKKASPPGYSLALAFTNDAMGELSDCGCKGGASGGLGKRIAYINQLREQFEGNFVAIEAGNFLFAVEPENDVEREMERQRAQIVAEAYGEGAYDAVLFGRRDYALGLPLLQELAEDFKTTILGANVTDAATGQPLWTASKIVERGGVRVGLFGLITNKNEIDGKPYPWPAGVSIENPVATAQRIAPDLRKRCDVMVLVANLDRDELQSVLGDIDDVDFVIKSRKAKILSHQVERIKKTPVVGIYELGRYVGRLEITFVRPKQRFADLAERQILERKIERYRQYVDALADKAGGLDKVETFYAHDAQILGRFKRYQESIARWEKELDELPDKGNRFRYLLVELDDKVPTDEAIDRRVADFEQRYGKAADARGRQLARRRAVSEEVLLPSPQE